jgi:F420-dependent oxidoreductase-like protein
MRFAILVEPQQGLAYEEILAIALAAEGSGLETFFRSDHYVSFPGSSDRPTTDAWTTLAGIARETSTIGLGVLVSPVTFRAPGVLAKIAATVDGMSGGRVEVGLGAGWNDLEHSRYGLAFPDLRARFEMLEEQLTIVRSLWTKPAGWSFEGRYWSVRDADFRAPGSGRDAGHVPPIIVGGEGQPKSSRLAATWADEFNFTRGDPEAAATAYATVRDVCLRIGRDPDTLVRSALVGTLVARSSADLAARSDALGEMVGVASTEGSGWLDERRPRWIIGTHEEALERIAAYEAAGAQRIVFQDFLPRDLDMVRELGELAQRYGAGR